MKLPHLADLVNLSVLCALLLLAAAPRASGQATPAAVSAFNAYAAAVEARLARQHQTPTTFLAASALTPETLANLRHGDLALEQLTPPGRAALPGALLHHWRGTSFVRGASAADFQRLMQNISAYPQIFAPQVLRARLLSRQGNHFQALLRLRQQHILTVVLDTTYDIAFGQLDPQHVFSLSRSLNIAEIASPGTSAEHALPPEYAHGFLWRLNTYWSCAERDGGLYIQVESISLTRSIPRGLGWAVGPFVQSIPRESLSFTLRSTQTALERSK